MALPNVRPFNEWVVTCKTASVGATPIAALCVAPVKGHIVRTYAVTEGTTSGTVAVAVGVNGGSDIGTGSLSLAAGANSTASDSLGLASTTNAVNEGDTITFTPSGGGGSNIPATFHAVIREQ